MGRSAIWVRIQHEGEGWSGRLMPGRQDRIHVHFHPDKGPAHMPLATMVRLGVAQPGMAAAMQDEAQLIRVDSRREDALECVFELTNPERLSRGVPGAVIDQRTDDRRHLRAAPGPTDVMVPVTLPDGPPSAQRLVGRMIDGGAGGLGLSFPMVAEPLLCRARSMRAQVPLPGLQGTGMWVCDVRYRMILDEDHVRYGLQFMSDGVAVDPPGPQLESLWDCEHCGTQGLLDETHAHCPACGRQGQGPRHHPSWRELATADVHPLCGIDANCLNCGVAYGERAAYCGHCGTRLPTEELEDTVPYASTRPGS